MQQSSLSDGNPGFTALIKCLNPITEFLGVKPQLFISNINSLNKKCYSKKTEYRVGLYQQILKDIENKASFNIPLELTPEQSKTFRQYIRSQMDSFIGTKGNLILPTELLVNVLIPKSRQIEVNHFNTKQMISFYYKKAIASPSTIDSFISFISSKENFDKFKGILSKQVKAILRTKINNLTYREIWEAKYHKNYYESFLQVHSG